MYSFFAFFDRLKFIERWSLMYSGKKENVAEHSHAVAVIAYALGIINNVEFNGTVNPERLASLAVFHESSEALIGDLPTPVKYNNPDIKTAYKALERVANDKLLSHLPDKMAEVFKKVIVPNDDEHTLKLLKAADKLAALIKCIEELKMGNSEFKKARISIESEIKKLELKEAAYFLDNFIHAFMLTLDELDS